MNDDDEATRWENVYGEGDVESLPWFYPGLDPDFGESLKRQGINGGEMLDLCTGPGTQAIAMAKLGYSVNAVDISATAIRKAKARESGLGLEIDFRQANILTSDLAGDPAWRFDIVFDRGCYHVFPDEKRVEYVPAVGQLIKTEGWLFLKCFSNKEKRPEGPYRIAPDEIRVNFEELFEVVSINETVFQGIQHSPLPRALICVMRRR